MKEKVHPSLKRWAGPSLIAVLVLAALWIVPPVLQRSLHLCPVRPDGVEQAGAVPAFARKYGIGCEQCHTAWPLLNDYGRQFKLNGYVRETGGKEGVEENKGDNYWTEKMFPLSVVVRSRPYDKTNTLDNDFRMQPIKDVDFFVAGGDAAKHLSVFAEIDANSDNSFTPSMADLQLGYHPSSYVNVIGARRGFFVMDPYQTLSNFGSPTVANRAVAGLNPDQGMLSMSTMDETKQTAAVYGTVDKEGVGELYYAVGATADNGADSGSGPKDGNVRLAFDTLKGVMLGVFGVSGHEGPNVAPNNLTDRIKFEKGGIDAMVEKGPVVGRAAFMTAHETDDVAQLSQSDRAGYAELMYVYKRGVDPLPFLVPLVRWNGYTTMNGTRSFTYVTAQLAHYFQANLKGFLEYSFDTRSDLQGTNTTPTPKSNRLTAQVELGF